MKPTFWKLSQGWKQFDYQSILWTISKGLVYVHNDTKAKATSLTSQAQDFVGAPIGDYFYLTHGNHGIYLLGQFAGPPNLFSTKGKGWLDRPFRMVMPSIKRDHYEGPHKWWTPSDHSTFTAVPDDELELFEREILRPFFGVRLKDFGLHV